MGRKALCLGLVMRDYGVYEHPTFFVVDENGEENLGRYDRRVNSEVVTDCFSGSVTGQRMVGETLYFLNTDGVDIDGFVMKPVGYEPGKRYPGILHIHGGPKMVFGPGFHHEMQLWAASGFFVCYCNPRGSCGKGNAFADLQGKYGEVDFRDLMEFTDEVLRRYPEIDADRMGVAGGSYGGFMTNWVIGHTDRFRCAVSQRSIANYVGDYLLSDIGYYYVLTSSLAPFGSIRSVYGRRRLLPTPTVLRRPHSLFTQIRITAARWPTVWKCSRHSSSMAWRASCVCSTARTTA